MLKLLGKVDVVLLPLNHNRICCEEQNGQLRDKKPTSNCMKIAVANDR